MQATKKINVDLVKKGVREVVFGVQGDANTRTIEINLFCDSVQWNVPARATTAVSYEKADGTKGMYDTLPTGESAITIENNCVTVILAPEIFKIAGLVHASLVINDKELNQIATFPFVIDVSARPGAGEVLSNDYYAYSTLEEISAATEIAVRLAKNAAAAIVDTEDMTGMIVLSRAADGIPLINWRAFGDVGALSGGNYSVNPTPDFPVPVTIRNSVKFQVWDQIVNSVASDGQIVLFPTTVVNKQMCGFVVTNADNSNYVDPSGKYWMTDEVDFAESKHIQRITTTSFDGTEDWYLSSAGAPSIASDVFEPLKNFNAGANAPDNGNYTYMRCSHFKAVPRRASKPETYVSSLITARGNVVQFTWSNYNGDLEGWKSWLAQQAAAGTPVTMFLGMKKPVETDLGIMTQYTADHTLAYQASDLTHEITYIADTKRYIDYKISAISHAILNN